MNLCSNKLDLVILSISETIPGEQASSNMHALWNMNKCQELYTHRKGKDETLLHHGSNSECNVE